MPSLRPWIPAIASFAVAASTSAFADSIILIPDTLRDRVWAFDAFDGAVISSDYIPADGQMKQVQSIVQLPSGNLVMLEPATSIECSSLDGLLEYSPCGTFIRRIVGEADGACDAQQGCVVGDRLWFVRADINPNTPVVPPPEQDPKPPGLNGMWSINLDGTGLIETLRHPTLIRMNGMARIASGFVASDGGSSPPCRLVHVSADGTTMQSWYEPPQASTFLNFPQQVSPMPGGGVAVACFSGAAGVYFFDAAGQPRKDINWYHPAQGAYNGLAVRGCHPLGNGEVLYCGGTVVGAFDPTTGADRLIVNALGGTSGMSAQALFRFISKVERCSCDLNCDARVDGQDLGVLLGDWGSAGTPSDINGDGTVDGQDLGVLLGSWGACFNP